MKLNRVLPTFVLTALLSGATMVAHAQTGVYLQFGGGRAPVVAAQYYQPPYPGPGYVWIAGYYNDDGYWVPGYWVRRGDDDDDGGAYYGAYYNNYYGYNNYYRGDDDHRWRRDDDWRDNRGWRGDDHHDNGWHRGWRRHHDDDH